MFIADSFELDAFENRPICIIQSHEMCGHVISNEQSVIYCIQITHIISLNSFLLIDRWLIIDFRLDLLANSIAPTWRPLKEYVLKLYPQSFIFERFQWLPNQFRVWALIECFAIWVDHWLETCFHSIYVSLFSRATMVSVHAIIDAFVNRTPRERLLLVFKIGHRLGHAVGNEEFAMKYCPTWMTYVHWIFVVYYYAVIMNMMYVFHDDFNGIISAFITLGIATSVSRRVSKFQLPISIWCNITSEQRVIHLYIAIGYNWQEHRRLLFYGHDYMYPVNEDELLHPVLDEASKKLWIDTAKVMTVFTISIALYGSHPLYLYIFHGTRPMLVPVYLPFINQDEGVGYYINIMNQYCMSYMYILDSFAHEISFAIILSNLWTGVSLIKHAVSQLNATASEKTAVELKCDLIELIKKVCDMFE